MLEQYRAIEPLETEAQISSLHKEIMQDPSFSTIVEGFLESPNIERVVRRLRATQTGDPFESYDTMLKVYYGGEEHLIQLTKVVGVETVGGKEVPSTTYRIYEIDEKNRQLKKVSSSLLIYIVSRRGEFVRDEHDTHILGPEGFPQTYIPVHILQDN